MTIPHRIAREFVHQLDHAGEDERLARALSTIPLFMSLNVDRSRFDVLALWSRLDGAHDVEGAYRRSLAQWQAPTIDQRIDALFEGQVILARLDWFEGNDARATERLRHLAADASGDDERAAVRYWLWKLEAGDRSEALRLYRELVEVMPKYEYRVRIEELSAVTIGGDQV